MPRTQSYRKPPLECLCFYLNSGEQSLQKYEHQPLQTSSLWATVCSAPVCPLCPRSSRVVHSHCLWERPGLTGRLPAHLKLIGNTGTKPCTSSLTRCSHGDSYWPKLQNICFGNRCAVAEPVLLEGPGGLQHSCARSWRTSAALWRGRQEPGDGGEQARVNITAIKAPCILYLLTTFLLDLDVSNSDWVFLHSSFSLGQMKYNIPHHPHHDSWLTYQNWQNSMRFFSQ